MRHLATIREITTLRPIAGADRIEVAQVDGWECVVQKGEFHTGEHIVYIEVDSIVPERPEFEFLRDRKFRVRTIKLRGQVSQGLVLPLSILPNGAPADLGADVTDVLGIKKYDPEAQQEAQLLTKQPAKPKVIAWTQEVSANYPVTDIFGDKRTEINAELDTYLREKFDQYGIIIDTVNFTDISVDEETAAAIQKKVTAQQELELANIEKQTAKIQAEKDREVAQINAEKAVIEAEAKAEALRIAAEAEAEANRMIAGSLTGELIEKIKYEQWNGELPTVTGSSSIISIEP